MNILLHYHSAFPFLPQTTEVVNEQSPSLEWRFFHTEVCGCHQPTVTDGPRTFGEECLEELVMSKGGATTETPQLCQAKGNASVFSKYKDLS